MKKVLKITLLILLVASLLPTLKLLFIDSMPWWIALMPIYGSVVLTLVIGIIIYFYLKDITTTIIYRNEEEINSNTPL